MRKIPVVLILTIALIMSASSLLFVSATRKYDVESALQKRISTSGNFAWAWFEDSYEKVDSRLPRFYDLVDYKLVWSKNKIPIPQAYELYYLIKQIDQDGLEPDQELMKKMHEILLEIDGKSDKASLIDLDLMFTDAFLTYGSYLLSGRLDGEWLFPQYWQADLVDIMRQILVEGRVKEAFNSLLPLQPAYGRLKEALAWYREIDQSGGWPEIPPGEPLKNGDSGDRVLLLRKRLLSSGDLEARGGEDEMIFDQALEEALKRFQARHGLSPDGIVGQQTLEKLNIAASDKINKIIINMERLRWLPQSPGRRYVMVNIPGFQLQVFEEEIPVFSMKVIVGRRDRQTPVFGDEITHMVINPYWRVPDIIFRKDILPAVRKDPNYLAEKNIKVFDDWHNNAKEIPAEKIDWQRVNPKSFPYMLRQEPGPENSLGRIKFIFPNKHDVYLHDTPHKELFNEDVRAFSSGCIRIEKPVELADYLMENDDDWNKVSIIDTITSGHRETVYLSLKVPIYILYLTTWVDPDGIINFRDDIYGRDTDLTRLLNN